MNDKDDNFHSDWAYLYDWVYETSFGSGYGRMGLVTTDAVRDLLPSTESRIADIGAGTGRLTLPLLDAGYEISAIDSSKAMLNVLEGKLKADGKQTEIIHAPMSQFKTKPVDLALCVFTVFIYVTEDDELSASLENISNHLKPGGYFLFDLASDMFFQQGTVMSHRSDQLTRSAKITHIKDEIFEMRDHISGIHDGKEFIHEEVFNVRRWDTDTVFGHLNQNGLQRVDFDDSNFRFTGSRYFLFRKS